MDMKFDLLSEMNNLDEINKNISLLQKFLQTLPEKALNFGVKVLLAAIFLIIGLKLVKLIRKIVRHSLERAKVEIGAVQFLDSLIKVCLTALLIIAIANNFGFDATSIVALIGSVGVTIGLALQGSLSNLAGGVLILLLKPFRVGDYIKEDSKGNEGTVREIGIFYTKLMTVDQKIIVLPNGTLSNNSITNYSEAALRRIDLTVGISYSSDIEKAKEVLRRLLENDKDVNKTEQINVFVDALGNSEVVLGMRCYVDNAKYWEVRWRLIENMKYELEKVGVEIPFTQISIHMEK